MEELKTSTNPSLYNKWIRVHRQPHSEEFDTYAGFYEWAMCTDYADGDMLKRENTRAPFSPDNCYWLPADAARVSYGIRAEAEAEMVAQWNKTVNRFRKYYGLPLFNEGLPKDQE